MYDGPVLAQLFVVGRRAHGTRDVIEALYARHRGRARRAFNRVLTPKASGPLMIVNDWATLPNLESDFDLRGPKQRFFAHHGGDGLHELVTRDNRRCDGALWVLSARAELEPSLVDDVITASLLDAQSIVVFVNDVDEDRAGAHRCEQFARAALDEAGLGGDARTVIFDTGLASLARSTAWHDGIDQLFDALERECPPRAPRALPMAFDVTTRTGSELGGELLGAALSVGDEVELVRAGRRTTVTRIRLANGRTVESAPPGSWIIVALDGIDQREVEPSETIAQPGALSLVRELEGVAFVVNRAPAPARCVVRGYVGSAVATFEWLEAASHPRRPRAMRLRFEEPTPWLAGDRACVEGVGQYSLPGDGGPPLWRGYFEQR